MIDHLTDGPSESAHRHRRHLRRAAAVLCVLGASAAGIVPARAAWQSAGSGGPAIPATALPTGATPAASASGQNVTVSWSAASMGSAVVSYQVRRYQATTGVVQSIGAACSSTTTSLSCVEAGVPAGDWKYSDTPLYATWTGTESARSATVTTPPPVPTGVSASATSASAITVSWSAAAGATGYQVLRATVSGGPYTTVSSPAGTSFGDTALNSSTTYYYVVRAAYNAALSASSTQASATTQALVFGNGDFESGSLSPWVSTPAPGSSGTTGIYGTWDSYSPHGGASFGVVFPGGANTYSHLSQSFSVTAGQTISGWAYFDGTDYAPYTDDGAVVIQQGGADVATVFAAGIATLGDYGKTGWTHWTYTVPSSGTWTVDARVRNVTDGTGDSFVGIDDVVVS